ncbi:MULTISPECIES: glycosyltransferase family 1 protein [Rhodococcus]|uniref:glycosyltransferase family 4 protein n=1 Tax=Rhodococcus TaxID=1827 RepID=UPI000622C519|nr:MULTISPECIES: glycosyltransferase family 1 protein [Rhodococcus]AKE90987.1 GDP-mannose-dependent alpha-mannosyltransferase [Rhodococcus aetherivorans]QRI78313.1 glycosyltransferase family 1 protein [Rhodococcus aetherivorans]QSE61726.1 glycosyltransferase family 1 protein [Rhodococcus sp. PSBB066]QSE66964.1 glycosyltransferase family 1 protein [Rhodococcus sp. PSBB049]WFS15368.1 glycosyltransferase family 1 protein [Rhodococcus aetherivorans]
MRVAIVAESFLPNVNGVTNSVLRVLEHLDRHGHEALVVAPDTVAGQPPAPTQHDGIPVHRVPAVHVPRVSSLPVGLPQPALTGLLRGFAPDVVHLASPFLLGAGGLGAARRLDLPTVAVYQTDVAGFASSYGLGLAARAAWQWTRRIHRACDRTLAPSTAAAADLAAHGVPRVHRWARGVDTARFTPARRSAALRRTWSPDGRLVVGFVGRLAPEKHVERLAGLAADPRYRLVVVGDGPERARLEPLLPRAVFTGHLGGDALADAYASLDVFVHPGEHETFCQAVQEALASGVPVIAPDAGGPRDLVAHCRNGYRLPVDGFAELLPGAVGALADPMLRDRFGAAARRSVLGRTWPAVCHELLGHYEQVCSVRPGTLRRSA